MPEKQFYSYMYVRKDGTPYYVGKGTGKRAYNIKTHTAKPPKDKTRILIFPMLNEIEAFESEVALIALFGRKDKGTGILRNFTDGGEGSSGFVHSDEQRRKISEANKGKTFLPEHRKKLSISATGNKNGRGNKCHIYGAQSIETIAKRVVFLKGNKFCLGKTHSDETKIKMSRTRLGKSIASKGKPWSEARRKAQDARRMT